MNTSPDHTHPFGFGNSSGKHLGLQIAQPLSLLPSVHDLRLPQTPACQTGHTKDRAVPCLHKKPVTQPLGAMGQEPFPLELLSPQPRGKERLGSQRLSPDPRDAGQWRNLEKACGEGSWLASPSLSISQTCPLKRCIRHPSGEVGAVLQPTFLPKCYLGSTFYEL